MELLKATSEYAFDNGYIVKYWKKCRHLTNGDDTLIEVSSMAEGKSIWISVSGIDPNETHASWMVDRVTSNTVEQNGSEDNPFSITQFFTIH